jgi:hypothetical protein
MRRFLLKAIPILFLLVFYMTRNSSAQERINFLNGKVLNVKKIEVRDNKIAYYTLGEKSKLKKINPDRVFSLNYADSSEFIVYLPDASDPNDFSIEQLRMFIKGEQDATLYYKNNLNKGVAGVVGVGGGFLVSVYFIGFLVPPLYTTIVGGVSPDMDKQKVSDEALRGIREYREGYMSKVRNRKIRNSIISGFIGFAAGVTYFSIALQK